MKLGCGRSCRVCNLQPIPHVGSGFCGLTRHLPAMKTAKGVFHRMRSGSTAGANDSPQSFSATRKPSRRAGLGSEQPVQSDLKKAKDKEKDKKHEKSNKSSYKSSISGPFEVTHNVGVTKDMEWIGSDPLNLFRLESKLGEGSFGTVWLVTPKDNPNGLKLAVKHIKIDEDTDTNEIENEITILKKCQSSYIVSYYGAYKTPSLLWIIMDYCEMGSVLDMMESANAALGESPSAWVLQSSLFGLKYLHQMGVIHRDVKAANILVTGQGDLKLADFGVSETLAQSIPGQVAGSPLWMAPEVCQRIKCTPKSDIWSMGITAIELLDGDPPHTDMSPARLMLLIPRNDPPTVSDPTAVSSEFLEFLSLMLCKDPEGRSEIEVLLDHPWCRSAKKSDFQEAVKHVQSLESTSESSTYAGTLIPLKVAQAKTSVVNDAADSDEGYSTTLFSNSGTTVISNSGTTVISNSGTTVINNSGTTVISNPGATAQSNTGTTIISNTGTTVMSSGDDASAYSTTIIQGPHLRKKELPPIPTKLPKTDSSDIIVDDDDTKKLLDNTSTNSAKRCCPDCTIF